MKSLSGQNLWLKRNKTKKLPKTTNPVTKTTKAKKKILITNPKGRMVEVPEGIWSSRRVRRLGSLLGLAVWNTTSNWQTPGNSNKK